MPCSVMNNAGKCTFGCGRQEFLENILEDDDNSEETTPGVLRWRPRLRGLGGGEGEEEAIQAILLVLVVVKYLLPAAAGAKATL